MKKKHAITKNTPQPNSIASVIDEHGSPGHAHMLLEQMNGETCCNFTLSLQSDTQPMYATAAIAVSFVVTGDDGGFAVPADWLDFPIFDRHGNTLLWSESEYGPTILTVTLKEGQSVLEVSFVDFQDGISGSFIDLNQALKLRLVSIDALDANGDPLEESLAGLDPRIAIGDPDVPYLTAYGGEQFPLAPVDAHYGGILAGNVYDSFDWQSLALGGADVSQNVQSHDTLRFDDVFGDSAAGQTVLDDLLGNAANYDWLANADGSGGLFIAMDGHGTKIKLSIDDTAAMLTVTHRHGDTTCTQNVELQHFDAAEHPAGTLEAQAVAQMLQEIIKIGGTG